MIDVNAFRGRRVLVVEDEMMIAMMLEDILGDLGCAVIGPAHSLETAFHLATTEERIDVAVLDVNLDGRPVSAVADALRGRGVPAIFSTGYGHAGLREQDKDAPLLHKPFRAVDLTKALALALGLAESAPASRPAPGP